MTDASCAADGCDRPVRDATVCRDCEDDLAKALGDIPALSVQLDITLTRQAVIGDGSTRRSAETPLPFHYAASEAGWVLRNTLASWVRVLTEEA